MFNVLDVLRSFSGSPWQRCVFRYFIFSFFVITFKFTYIDLPYILTNLLNVRKPFSQVHLNINRYKKCILCV